MCTISVSIFVVAIFVGVIGLVRSGSLTSIHPSKVLQRLLPQHLRHMMFTWCCRAGLSMSPIHPYKPDFYSDFLSAQGYRRHDLIDISSRLKSVTSFLRQLISSLLDILSPFEQSCPQHLFLSGNSDLSIYFPVKHNLGGGGSEFYVSFLEAADKHLGHLL